MSKTDDLEQVLFPMNHIVTTCGISRATLLRFEDEGLLIPARKDPGNGYRYYNCENLAQIIKILQFQHLGFTKKEIRSVLDDPESLSARIEDLKKKYLIMLRALEDISAERTQPDDIRIRILPTMGGTFFTRVKKITYSPSAVRKFAIETLEDFLAAKVPGNTRQTMKIYIDDADYRTCYGQFDGKPHLVRVVIPTEQPTGGPDYIEIPPCTMLTSVCQCDYSRSGKYFEKIWEEARKMGFSHDGPVCLAGFPEVFASSNPDMKNTTLRLMLRTTEKPAPHIL